jgi:hypothetical protein
MKHQTLGWITGAVIMLVLGSTPNAHATRTVCSDPSRARTLAQTKILIPEGDEVGFAATIRRFDKVTDMSLSEVISSNGDVFERRIMIFQSPKVSVAIEVHTMAGKNTSLATIERTCYNNALEEWQPYWLAFRRFLNRSQLHQLTVND